MKILGYDPFLSKEEIEKRGYEYFSDYEELVKEEILFQFMFLLLKKQET